MIRLLYSDYGITVAAISRLTVQTCVRHCVNDISVYRQDSCNEIASSFNFHFVLVDGPSTSKKIIILNSVPHSVFNSFEPLTHITRYITLLGLQISFND